MIGPITFVRGIALSRKIERFRLAMAACGEMAPSRMSDAEIMEDLLEQVRQAAVSEIAEGGRVRRWRELEKGAIRLLESATFAAESKAGSQIR